MLSEHRMDADYILNENDVKSRQYLTWKYPKICFRSYKNIQVETLKTAEIKHATSTGPC